jgi:hypothetical protein
MEFRQDSVVAQTLELMSLPFSATLFFNTSTAAFFLHRRNPSTFSLSKTLLALPVCQSLGFEELFSSA